MSETEQMKAVRNAMEKRADEVRVLATLVNTSVEDLGAIMLLAAEMVAARSVELSGGGPLAVIAARHMTDAATNIMETKIRTLLLESLMTKKREEMAREQR